MLETQGPSNHDLAELRPQDFHLPTPRLPDDTAVKVVEGRESNETLSGFDLGVGVNGGAERVGTVRLGETIENLRPGVEGHGEKAEGQGEITEATEVPNIEIATDIVDEDQVGEIEPRRSKRQTAGKHSNPHRLPKSVNQQEVASQQVSITEQSLADLSQAHKMLVELFAKIH